jgi:hypothetical protein
MGTPFYFKRFMVTAGSHICISNLSEFFRRQLKRSDFVADIVDVAVRLATLKRCTAVNSGIVDTIKSAGPFTFLRPQTKHSPNY